MSATYCQNLSLSGIVWFLERWREAISLNVNCLPAETWTEEAFPDAFPLPFFGE